MQWQCQSWTKGIPISHPCHYFQKRIAPLSNMNDMKKRQNFLKFYLRIFYYHLQMFHPPFFCLKLLMLASQMSQWDVFTGFVILVWFVRHICKSMSLQEILCDGIVERVTCQPESKMSFKYMMWSEKTCHMVQNWYFRPKLKTSLFPVAGQKT